MDRTNATHCQPSNMSGGTIEISSTGMVRAIATYSRGRMFRSSSASGSRSSGRSAWGTEYPSPVIVASKSWVPVVRGS